MDLWMKIGATVLMVMMIVMIWPRARDMMKNSPKAGGSEWMTAVIPLLLVAGFVALLIVLV